MLKAVRRVKRQTAAMGRAATSTEVRALIAALHSSDGTVRHSARESLVKTGKPATRPLMEALRSPSEHVRWEAAKALGEIRDKPAAPALVAALEDESAGIRWLAAEGLTALGSNALRPLLRALVKRARSIWLREGALHILRDMAKQGLRDETRSVVAALEGPAPTVTVPLAAGHVTVKHASVMARRRRPA